MNPATHHLSLEVPCPACADTYAVSLAVVEEAQRLLDEYGPCSGFASYECPAEHYAALAPREAIERLEDALGAFDRDVRRCGARAVWAGCDDAASQPLADLASLTVALGRWENDGGAPRRS